MENDEKLDAILDRLTRLEQRVEEMQKNCKAKKEEEIINEFIEENSGLMDDLAE